MSMNTLMLFSLLAAAEPPKKPSITRKANEMMARHISVWSNPDVKATEINPMRSVNPEWDFMGRTFVVLGLASVSLAEPSRQAELLPVIDQIIEDTIQVEAAEGQQTFLLRYAQYQPWKDPSGRSLFVDGEIALMIGARRLVADDGRWDQEHKARIDASADQISRSPALLGESYPDETWMFCNAVAMAALRIYDALEPAADHSALTTRWIERMKQDQRDAQTGLLVSSTTWSGERKDGPEGSTIWLVSHMLQFVDPIFAEDQYQRARRELGRTLLGMGYALEWPVGQEDWQDVDAGEIVPGLGASTSSSGLAIIAARSFSDKRWHAALLRALGATARPEREGGELRYARGNQVGDAVIFYGMVEGPLREKLTAIDPPTP